MAISEWPGHRIALMWIVGSIATIVLFIGLPTLARRHVQRMLPRLERELAQLEREQAAVEGRWRLSEQADSVSVASQRRTAIAAGQFAVTPRGDTIIAVVRTPSGRPDSTLLRASDNHTRWIVAGIAFVLFGSIPLALAALTGVWLFARRRNGALPMQPNEEL